MIHVYASIENKYSILLLIIKVMILVIFFFFFTDICSGFRRPDILGHSMVAVL